MKLHTLLLKERRHPVKVRLMPNAHDFKNSRLIVDPKPNKYSISLFNLNPVKTISLVEVIECNDYPENVCKIFTFIIPKLIVKQFNDLNEFAIYKYDEGYIMELNTVIRSGFLDYTESKVYIDNSFELNKDIERLKSITPTIDEIVNEYFNFRIKKNIFEGL